MENDSKKVGGSRGTEDSGDMKETGNSVMRSDITNKNSKQDEDLPGYPHYPANEDLLNPLNNEGRIEVDVENLSQSARTSNLDYTRQTTLGADTEAAQPVTPAMKDDEGDLGIVPGTDADLTEDDLVVLGSIDKDMDLGEDEEINSRSGWDMSVTGEDLDVPGAENDDANEELGEEDEENNYYSLGGDAHDNLEDPS